MPRTVTRPLYTQVLLSDAFQIAWIQRQAQWRTDEQQTLVGDAVVRAPVINRLHKLLVSTAAFTAYGVDIHDS